MVHGMAANVGMVHDMAANDGMVHDMAANFPPEGWELTR
jgi:hypothetical protein